MVMPAPRTRFCPAPSGWLHVGSARTALYNYLWARRTNGAYVFRIEDTDADRVSDESVQGMIESLRWLGLDWDEGPEVEGPYGPYRQRDRQPLYLAVVDRLLKAGHAYDAYETTQELAAMREAAQREGRPPGYNGQHRWLSDEQRNRFLYEGRQPTIRLRTPDEGTVEFDDLVRGQVQIDWATISDYVILRADDTPTYYLANVVDDLAMGINLIARGEDLLSATARQIHLMELLLAGGLIDDALSEAGYPARPQDAGFPRYAHLPLIVGEDRKPLSKRHADVAVDEYRRQGYLPEVMVNFLALLGWSWDGVTERMDLDELGDRFSFERVGRNPAAFDTAKLRSMNGDRIKEMDDRELAERLLPYFQDAGLIDIPPAPDHQRLLLGLTPLLRERIQVLSEALGLASFAFRGDVVFDERAVAKHLKPPADGVLDAAEQSLSGLDDWTAERIHSALDGVAEQLGLGRGKAFQPIRVAVTGTAVSPPLPETLALLDRDLVIARIRAARPMVSG
jgi:glutamyl-tRNA synthetase